MIQPRSLVLLLLLTACGESEPGEPPGGAAGGPAVGPGVGGGPVVSPSIGGAPGTGGNGGASNPGGAGEAGGPMGNAGAGGEAPECMPDEGIASIGPECLFSQTPADLGIPDDPTFLDVFSRELNVPVTAGQPYATSFEVRGSAHTFELWGAGPHSLDDLTCGVASELLVSVEIPGDGSYCVDFVATQNHDYWLEVIRGGGEGSIRTQINYCPNTTCP